MNTGTTRPDAQPFDEIRIVTVPRYKESELSGNEWRISAKIELVRKGRVVHEESFGTVESAVRFLPFVHARAQDDGKGYFASEEDFCDQEGCSEKATVFYKKKMDYCDRGDAHPILYGDKTRQFCDKHKQRGDCGRDDADSNYTVLSKISNNNV